MKDCASEVKALTALWPQLASGESSAVYGITIDRKSWSFPESGVAACIVGAASGEVLPSVFGVTFKVQEGSGESSINWSDISGATHTVSGERSVTERNYSGEINLDLRSVERYIRVVATPHYQGGTNPKIQIGAVVVLGEARAVPI